MIGLDPRPFTLRSLDLMVTGRKRSLWETASAQMALLANCNRNPKKRPQPFRPDDFNPFADTGHKRRGELATPEIMAAMKKSLEAMRR